MTPTALRLALAGLACSVAVVAGGCGSSSDHSSSSSGTSTSTSTSGPPASASTASTSSAPATAGGDVSLAADSSRIAFDKKALQAKAGKVTITMTNKPGGQIPHAIAIEGNGVDKDGKTAQAGGTSTVTADLKPGRYTFYCPVSDHREEGMKGTLTVK